MVTTYAMGLRSGNWDYPGTELAFHSDVDIQLAPSDAPGVLVRFVSGIPVVTRELRAADVVEIQVCDAAGRPRLRVRPAGGLAERMPAPHPGGVWELRIDATRQRQVHLYAREHTPFPSEEDLDALASGVGTAVPSPLVNSLSTTAETTRSAAVRPSDADVARSVGKSTKAT